MRICVQLGKITRGGIPELEMDGERVVGSTMGLRVINVGTATKWRLQPGGFLFKPFGHGSKPQTPIEHPI